MDRLKKKKNRKTIHPGTAISSMVSRHGVALNRIALGIKKLRVLCYPRYQRFFPEYGGGKDFTLLWWPKAAGTSDEAARNSRGSGNRAKDISGTQGSIRLSRDVN